MTQPSSYSPQQQPEFLRLNQVLAWTGLGRSTIYRMVAHANFPPPVKLSQGAVGWRRSDVEAWGQGRKPTTTQTLPRAATPGT